MIEHRPPSATESAPGRMVTRRTLLGATTAGALTGLVAPAAQAAPRRGPVVGGLEVLEVARAHRLDRLWGAYGNRSGALGWAGADGTYSTPLPDGTLLWLFNDTFLGPVGPGRSIRELGPVHNTFVTWRGRPLRTVLGAGSTEQAPLPTVGAAGNDTSWYWNGHGIVDDGALRVFEYEQVVTADDHFGFRWVATAVATFSLPDLQLVDLTEVPNDHEVQWGVQLVPHGDHVLIYGQAPAPIGKAAHLARARRDALLGPWQFWDGTGWVDEPAASVPVAEDVGASFGVTRVQDTWLLSTSDSFLGSGLYLAAAASPVGPFTERVQVFTAPEGLPAADEEADGDVYGPYNIAAHPELGGPDRLVLSYNVNSTAITDLWGDIDHNRARFLQITLARAG